MRHPPPTLSFVLIFVVACASTVGVNPGDAGTSAHDALSDGADGRSMVGPDVPPPTVLPTCAVSLQPCSGDGACAGSCDRRCVQWRFGLPDGGAVLQSPVCAVARAGRCIEPVGTDRPLCPVGYVCPGVIEPMFQTCIRASDCIALQQRLAQEHPESNVLLRPGCRYSDQTLAHTGQLAPARCLDLGSRTCGLGCDSCPGDRTHPGVCLFVSEASSTGVCARATDAGYLERPCSRLAKSNPCGFGEACLLPLRNDIDRIDDDAREGICIARASCQAIAAAVSESYFCDTFGL